MGSSGLQAFQEVKRHPLSIYPEHSEIPWNKPHTEQLGLFFPLQNRVILDNPGQNLIIILDNNKFCGFCVFFLWFQCIHKGGQWKVSIGKVGYLFTYLSRRNNSTGIKKEKQIQWLSKSLNFHIFVRSQFSHITHYFQILNGYIGGFLCLLSIRVNDQKDWKTAIFSSILWSVCACTIK